MRILSVWLLVALCGAWCATAAAMCAPLQLFNIGVADQFVVFARGAVDAAAAASAVWGHSVGFTGNGIPAAANKGIKFAPTHPMVLEADLAMTAFFLQMTAANRPLNDLACNPRAPFPVGGITLAPLPPGVYWHAAALALAGTTVFDAQNNPGATFVVMVGGAMSVAATSQFVFLNGGTFAQVLWHVNGEVTTAASTLFGGTIFTTGAISMGASTLFDGSTAAQGAVALGVGCTVTQHVFAVGAISMDTSVVNGPATAIRMTVLQQPTGGTSLLPLNRAPHIEIINAFGHRRASDEVTVTVAIATWSGETPTLFGNTTVETVNGHATFG